MSGRKPFDFNDQLEKSKSALCVDSDFATIQRMLDGVAVIRLATPTEERDGIDYVATLRCGREVPINVKARQTPCKKFWNGGQPQVALEIWSVMPGGKYRTPNHRKATGWALCEKNKAELLLFKWLPSDCPMGHIVSAQLLRNAFRREYRAWVGDHVQRGKYRVEIQESNDGRLWESQCVFVPIDVVLRAIETHSKLLITPATGTPEPVGNGLDFDAHARSKALAEQMVNWRMLHEQSFVEPSADVLGEDGNNP